MATIERKPLPPLNASTVPIAEADRAEIMAGANAVIDHYVNGAGSCWAAGPRKPLGNENEDADSTIGDLTKFKESAIAFKQFADDPHAIGDSVVDLIDRTIDQVSKSVTVKDDRILRPLPDTNDPSYDPRVVSPNLFNPKRKSISFNGGQRTIPPSANWPSGVAGEKPIRFLGRRIVSQ